MSFPLTNPDSAVVCAAILAGGKSSRMGREKALIEVDGEPLIARTVGVLRAIFPEIVVVTASQEVENAASVPAIFDHFPHCGPLGGLHAAATHFGRPFFAVACDMPFLNVDFLRFLAAQTGPFDALVPKNEAGPEPLHAIYRPSCAHVWEELLREGTHFSLRAALGKLEVRWVADSEARHFDGALRMFENWNRTEDVRD